MSRGGPKLARPSRCKNPTGVYSTCDGKSFRKSPREDGNVYVCLTCGHEAERREVRPVDLVAATCRQCKESFLWKRTSDSRPEGPSFCRACNASFTAMHHEDQAEKFRKKAEELRASQRRAFARWKPPTSKAEADARKKT